MSTKEEKVDDFIGQRFGKDGHLEVVGRGKKLKSGRKYAVKCLICAQDPELFGDGIFYLEKTHLKKGTLPCGCAKHVYWTREQYEVRAIRKCEEVGFTYIGMSVLDKGIDTRVYVRCNIDGYEWGLSLDNLFRGKGCPQCMSSLISTMRKRNDEDVIRDFMATGAFQEGSTFIRSPKQDDRGYSHWWYVTCPTCSNDEYVQRGECSGIFESKHGNLLQGHRPCRCHSSGFNKGLPSHLYVLKIEGASSEFVGYGISNKVKRRLRTHKKNLKDAGFTIVETKLFEGSGQQVFDIECLLKDNFPRYSQDVVGFVKEATYYHLYEDVLEFVEEHIRQGKQMTFKPMLAYTIESTKDIRYPVFASYKLDGIRAVVIDGVVYSRSMKPIRSKVVQELFGKPEFNGLDGELLYGDWYAENVFNLTTQTVMATELKPEFDKNQIRFAVFDDVEAEGGYEERLNSVSTKLLASSLYPAQVKPVYQKFIQNEAELLAFEELILEEGYEGIMVRSIDGRYKQGRSTAKEGIIGKLKRFSQDEGLIIGFEEKMTNTNEAKKNELGRTQRSQSQEGLVGADTLGAFICTCDGITFTCGSGLDDALRATIWANKDEYLGKYITFTHFAIGRKDSFRFPIFKGFRDAEDMS